MPHPVVPGLVPLLLHPRGSAPGIGSLVAGVARDGGSLRFAYVLRGDVARVRFPAPAAPGFVPGLWESTCFEAFVPDGQGYVEFNFAPSGEWAAFRFDAYRSGMAALDQGRGAPQIEVRSTRTGFELGAVVEGGSFGIDVGGVRQLGLCAVIESRRGDKSYWAATHADPDRADFHRAASFVVPVLDRAA
jgi:hypothetical protein